MQRIRTVKPELFRHEGLFEAEQSYGLPLRLAFIGLFTCCDREGRFRWRPKQLKLDIFPYDEGLDMSRVLDALVMCGLIVKYAHETELYGCIPSWHKHQHINHRESDSLLPGFSKCNTVIETDKNNASRTCESRVDNAIGAHPGIPMGKGKGKELEMEKEGKGKWKGNMRDVSTVTRGLQDSEMLMTRDSRDEDVLTIFFHWKQVMNLPNAVCDHKRREVIVKALSMGYSVVQLCNAIDGCSNTPHNMGKNEQGQRYDGLHIIFRDADQIERFIRNFFQPPKLMQAGDNRSKSSVKNLQNWVDKKIAQDDRTVNKISEEKYEN